MSASGRAFDPELEHKGVLQGVGEVEDLAFSLMDKPGGYSTHFVDVAVSDAFPDGGHVDINEYDGLIAFVRNAEDV